MPQITIKISELQEAQICRAINAGLSFELSYPPGHVIVFGDGPRVEARGEIAWVKFEMRTPNCPHRATPFVPPED